MANFTNADVMALRQKTGVGMMDCKKALVETNGNIDEAIKYLREKGMATASKKADRIAAEGIVDSYIHMGGKIGVLVDVETDVVNDAVKEMAKNVAMQIAALNPKYTDESEVSADFIAHEKEILMAQIQNDPKESQKPEKVIQGMIAGRIKKEMKEICLLDQVYVKAEDGKQSVAKYVEQVAKENSAKIAVKGFVRFETGEGIEKKEENFAEEVAKQMDA